MENQYLIKLKRLAIILLSAAMLTSCASSAPEPQETDVWQEAEATNDGAENVQHRFDVFTRNLMTDYITSSGINLHYNLADPKARGISWFPATFGDYSIEALEKGTEETLELQRSLRSFPYKKLSESQQLVYEILDSSFTTDLTAKGLELYAEPISSMVGVQAQLPILLAEYAFYSEEDVENYLNLLSTIDEFYGQLMEFERMKAEADLFMSDRAADHVLESCKAYMVPADQSFLYETFNTRIDGLTDLSEEEKQIYKEQNLTVIEEHFLPAYQLLYDGLSNLKGMGLNDNGLCFLPEGKAYYEYLVMSGIAPSHDSVDDLLLAIEGKIEADLNSMSEITGKHPEVFDEYEDYQFLYTEPEDCLDFLKYRISEDFPELSENAYTVKYVPDALASSLSPAFYLTPPMDRYQENLIYINPSEEYANMDLFTTLAHEGYPGHLYQNVYFLSNNKEDIRNIFSYSSYSEGWATYVEGYAYTMEGNGLSEPLGELLKYNSYISLGLQAYLDIAINYEGWDREDVVEFLADYYGSDITDAANDIFDALVENPTNYLSYYVGALEIEDMKSEAQEILADRFDLKEFHKFILDIGPAPFSVIRSYFAEWLKEQ